MPALLCKCGREILVDEKDYLFVRDFKISCDKDGNLQVWFSQGTEAKAFGNLIIGPTPTGLELDHKDRNTHNNKEKNLRFVTRAQNIWNQDTSIKNTSGYKGVNLDKTAGWQSRITVNGKRIFLGLFSSPFEAAWVRNGAVIKYHKEFGVLNDLTTAPEFIGPVQSRKEG